MSDKCEHNNHSHFWLWWSIFILCMYSFADCSGEQTRMKNDIRQLQWQVQQCNTKK